MYKIKFNRRINKNFCVNHLRVGSDNPIYGFSLCGGYRVTMKCVGFGAKTDFTGLKLKEIQTKDMTLQLNAQLESAEAQEPGEWELVFVGRQKIKWIDHGSCPKNEPSHNG